MKQTWMKFSALVFGIALLAPVSLLAQKDDKDKENKEKNEKKDVQQIIITRKTDNNEKGDKVIVEINGDKITVNGKPIDEYKDKEGDVSVRLQKYKEMEGLRNRIWSNDGNNNFNYDNNFNFFNEDANHAMLGVTTEKAQSGVEIQNVTDKSGAEKAGLKEGDIITKIDDKKIEDPDDLSKTVKAHKPGDKVTITFLRDKKEQKVTAELSKWKGMGAMTLNGPEKMLMDNLRTIPGIRTAPFGQNWAWSGGSPKLGLSVQDTDDGKGVKVIDVDDESTAAKAGVKEDDVITEVDGKAVNNTDEISKIIKESKEKTSVMLKLQRSGKTQNIEVKMPRKIKTADL